MNVVVVLEPVTAAGMLYVAVATKLLTPLSIDIAWSMNEDGRLRTKDSIRTSISDEKLETQLAD